MGRIIGKAPVKSCVPFCGAGSNCMDGTKHAVNACIGLYCSRAKQKALHPQQMQGKRKSPASVGGVDCCA